MRVPPGPGRAEARETHRLLRLRRLTQCPRQVGVRQHRDDAPEHLTQRAIGRHPSSRSSATFHNVTVPASSTIDTPWSSDATASWHRISSSRRSMWSMYAQ
jgi:hypothetical protein